MMTLWRWRLLTAGWEINQSRLYSCGKAASRNNALDDKTFLVVGLSFMHEIFDDPITLTEQTLNTRMQLFTAKLEYTVSSAEWHYGSRATRK